MSFLAGGLAIAGAGAAAAALWYALPFAARRASERRLRERCARKRMLVLTFDDGPAPNLTPQLLDLLQQRDAHATFFVLGRRAERVPELLDRIAAEGHEIGSHSQTHLNAWKSTPLRVCRDVEASYRALSRWIPSDAVFRPPYGKLTLDLWWNARRHGRRLGWWTDVSGDTHSPLPETAPLLDTLRTRGGGVVLLHDFDRETDDTAARAAFVLSLTGALLDLAAAEGWTVGTLSELLSEEGR